MRTHPKLVKLSIVGAALLFIGTAAGVTQRTATQVARVSVCLKDNGQLRMLNGTSACDSNEQQLQWVVGGEVTDLHVGRGLTGTRDDGTIQLAVDPELIQSCRSCNRGRVFAGFNDGPGETPPGAEDPNHGDNLPGIGALRVPIGKYLVQAKLWINNPAVSRTTARCKLSAGSDFDWVEITIRERDSAVVSLLMVHDFTEEALAQVGCSDGHPGSVTTWSDLKITALEVPDFSNVFMGN